MQRTKYVVYNIYRGVKCRKNAEVFDTIAKSEAFKIEKIVSNGAKSHDDFWYDQNEDEFVMLLQGKAELLFENDEIVKLKHGDYMLIPKHVKHKIKYTSSKPKCIWLCVFGKTDR